MNREYFVQMRVLRSPGGRRITRIHHIGAGAYAETPEQAALNCWKEHQARDPKDTLIEFLEVREVKSAREVA